MNRYMHELPAPWLDALRDFAKRVGAYAPDDFENSRIHDVLECMGLSGWRLWHMAGPVWRLCKKHAGAHYVEICYHGATGTWSVGVDTTEHVTSTGVFWPDEWHTFDTLSDAVGIAYVLECLES